MVVVIEVVVLLVVVVLVVLVVVMPVVVVTQAHAPFTITAGAPSAQLGGGVSSVPRGQGIPHDAYIMYPDSP